MTQNIRLRIPVLHDTEKEFRILGLVRILTLLNILKDTEPPFRFPAMQNTESKFRIPVIYPMYGITQPSMHRVGNLAITLY